MRILSIFILLFSCFSYGANANKADIDLKDPNQVIRTVSVHTLTRINAERALLDSDPAYMKTVIEEELIPYFDYRYAAYKVMGSYLRKTSKEQRDNFVQAFKNYLVNTYGHILFEYKQQKFEVLDTPHFKDKKIISIAVKVRDDHEQVTQLVFKLRKNKKTGEWKVFDVIAEGVSMLSTKQSELGELIRKDGIDQVIELLKQKNSEFVS